MSEAPKHKAGRIYVLPPPLRFTPPRHTRQLREQLKAQDDAAFADTAPPPLEPFGQRLRHAQDVARARDQGYAQGYMDGLASRVHVTPAARMVSALLGAVACCLGFWGYHLVRAWL